MVDQLIARPLPTKDNTTQIKANINPCLERDSKPRSQFSSGPRPRGHWGRLKLYNNSFIFPARFTNDTEAF